MPEIQVAEARKRQESKSLSHLEIHPQLGGGHVVKHVYSGYQHEPKEYKFNENGVAKGGEHIQAHLDKHAGLPPMQSHEGEGDESTQEEQYEQA